jgi:hypothetical protein
MSITSVPFVGRIVARAGRELVARDQARAQKILQGVRPHGPIGVVERRKRHHHHHHHGHGHSSGAAASDPGSGTGSGTGGGSTGTAPSSSGTGVDVTDAGVTYTASVGVGNPPTQYTLLIDTGKLLDAPSIERVS